MRITEKNHSGESERKLTEELEEGQSLLLEVPQSPVVESDIHIHRDRQSLDGENDADDEHVESSVPMGTQYTQSSQQYAPASQQTPAPDTPFEVIRETPDSEQPAGIDAGEVALHARHATAGERVIASETPKLAPLTDTETKTETGTKSVLVSETPRVALLMRPPQQRQRETERESESDITILVPDSQPFGDTIEMAPAQTAGPQSPSASLCVPKSPAISTVQAPGSPVEAKLGGAAGGRSRYPRSSDSSPLRSLSLASPVSTSNTGPIAFVTTGNTAASSTHAAEKDTRPSEDMKWVQRVADTQQEAEKAEEGAIVCNLFAWGNSKKVYVSASSREKGLSAIAVPALERETEKHSERQRETEGAAHPVVLQCTATANSHRSAALGGRGRLARGPIPSQHGRGRGRGFAAPRRTGTFQPPRPNGISKRLSTAQPASSLFRPQHQEEQQGAPRGPQQGNQLPISLGSGGIRRATPRELLGTPESQESTERERESRQKDETSPSDHDENAEHTIEQRDEDGVGLSNFSISSGTDPTILFSSVVPTPANHFLCLANDTAVICLATFDGAGRRRTVRRCGGVGRRSPSAQGERSGE